MDSTPPTNPRRPSRSLRALRWLLAVGLVVGAEIWARSVFHGVDEDWYDRIGPETSLQGTVLCLGSSLTAQAVNELQFQRSAAALGTEVTVHNFGAGGSSVPLHWMALHHLLREDPERLRGAQVLIEAPGGLPFHYHPDELFSDRDFLVPADRADKLFLATAGWEEVGFLWRSPTTLEQKLAHTVRMATRSCTLWRDRERVGAALRAACRRAVSTAAGRLFAPRDAQVERLPELAARGGVQVDAQFQQRAKEMLDRFRDEARFRTEFPSDWDRSFFGELLDLLERHGARVMVYEPPLHSAYRAILERPETAAPRAAFEEFLGRRGVPHLRPDFEAEDPMFPDTFHLGKRSSPAFTKSLVRAWGAVGR